MAEVKTILTIIAVTVLIILIKIMRLTNLTQEKNGQVKYSIIQKIYAIGVT